MLQAEGPEKYLVCGFQETKCPSQFANSYTQNHDPKSAAQTAEIICLQNVTDLRN